MGAAGGGRGAAQLGPEGPRERLLAAVMEYVVDRGVGGFSLREVAQAIGTSHRMLIYHFGSREGLLVAGVQAVEAAQRAFLAELSADPQLPAGEIVRRMWRRLADPALGPSERLFFELYGQALQGRPGTTGLLDGIVDSWVEPVAADAGRLGLAPEAVRADARLGVAVMRGLLLDLLATGERAAVDAALERYASLVETVTRPPDAPPRD
ncbi:MAG TPA: TetR/AcrR family transcriptional regulator [Chloroflexota bacterium]|nr:TetR/AcrR family transcriptional regulator [Chloroflexota bacterium]